MSPTSIEAGNTGGPRRSLDPGLGRGQLHDLYEKFIENPGRYEMVFRGRLMNYF